MLGKAAVELSVDVARDSPSNNRHSMRRRRVSGRRERRRCHLKPSPVSLAPPRFVLFLPWVAGNRHFRVKRPLPLSSVFRPSPLLHVVAGVAAALSVVLLDCGLNSGISKLRIRKGYVAAKSNQNWCYGCRCCCGLEERRSLLRECCCRCGS